ncbi:hypothetical protein B0H14DRAFT_2605578 [Mycena olivaceomarginata]|nr:hypothetical protein B0H14DRAFT_2605578 [Mycena olivaceomarginata]
MYSKTSYGRRIRPDAKRVNVGVVSDELLSNGSGDKMCPAALGCILASCAVGVPVPTPSAPTSVTPATSCCQMAAETKTHPDTERADVGDATDELLSNGSGDKALGCTLASCAVGGPVPTPSAPTSVAPPTSCCQMAAETKTHPDLERVDFGGVGDKLVSNGSPDEKSMLVPAAVPSTQFVQERN